MSSDQVSPNVRTRPPQQHAENTATREDSATAPLQSSTGSAALRDTLQRLAVGLAALAPEQEQEWTVWALTELREIREGMGRQGAGEEATDSFLEEGNLAPALARRGRRLQENHDDLLLQARMLLLLLTHDGVEDTPDFPLIKRRVELLLSGLHKQEVREKDLIFENLCVDIGTGD